MVFHKQLANSLVTEYKRWILIISKLTYPPIILKIYFQKIYLNIILLCDPIFYFQRGLTAKILYATFVSVIWTAQSDLPHNTGWTVFITINIFNFLFYSSILGPNIFMSSLYLNAVIIFCFWSRRQHGFTNVSWTQMMLLELK
jgi:hypothetical protein